MYTYTLHCTVSPLPRQHQKIIIKFESVNFWKILLVNCIPEQCFKKKNKSEQSIIFKKRQDSYARLIYV